MLLKNWPMELKAELWVDAGITDTAAALKDTEGRGCSGDHMLRNSADLDALGAIRSYSLVGAAAV